VEVDVEVVRRRARPLVYVYELPSDFTSGVHQRRFREQDCVPRHYTDTKDGGQVNHTVILPNSTRSQKIIPRQIIPREIIQSALHILT